MDKNKHFFEIAATAGKILISSGAESNYVEDTMEEILGLADDKKRDTLALLTSITLTLELNDGTRMSATRRIKSRSYQLGKIDKVDFITRKLKSNEIELEDAEKELEELLKPTKDTILINVCKVLSAVGFSLMMGGCFIIKAMPDKLETIPLIARSLMFLFPGNIITNSIRDVINEDFITGGGNMLRAVVVAAALGLGAGFGVIISKASFVASAWEYNALNLFIKCLGAFLGVVVIAHTLGVKVSRIFIIGGIGFVSLLVFEIMMYHDIGLFLSMFTAAGVLALLAKIFSIIFKSTPIIFFIPALYPIVLGATIFNAAVSFTSQNGEGKTYAINVLIAALGIAIGMLVINTVFKLYDQISSFAKKRKEKEDKRLRYPH